MELAEINSTSPQPAPLAEGAVRSSSSCDYNNNNNNKNPISGISNSSVDSSAQSIRITQNRRLIELQDPQDRGCRAPISAIPPSPTTREWPAGSPVSHKSKMEDLAVEVCGENGAYYKVGFSKSTQKKVVLIIFIIDL